MGALQSSVCRASIERAVQERERALNESCGVRVRTESRQCQRAYDAAMAEQRDTCAAARGRDRTLAAALLGGALELGRRGRWFALQTSPGRCVMVPPPRRGDDPSRLAVADVAAPTYDAGLRVFIKPAQQALFLRAVWDPQRPGVCRLEAAGTQFVRGAAPAPQRERIGWLVVHPDSRLVHVVTEGEVSSTTDHGRWMVTAAGDGRVGLWSLVAPDVAGSPWPTHGVVLNAEGHLQAVSLAATAPNGAAAWTPFVDGVD